MNAVDAEPTGWQHPPGIVHWRVHFSIVDGGSEYYLVDSAWGEEETRRLADWIEEATGAQLTLMVSTHHHADGASGVGYLADQGTRVVAHPRAVSLMADAGISSPPETLTELMSPGTVITLGPLEIFYPGAAHAEDNVVVWIPKQRILFGGCAVRPLNTMSLGNTSDAEIDSWPRSIEKVRERYSSAEIVVPGHGDPGGTEVLDHTIEIVRAASRSDM